MIEISRDEAETLFLKHEVINSRLNQSKRELNIHMTLSDQSTCLIKYNLTTHTKSYFVDPHPRKSGD